MKRFRSWLSLYLLMFLGCCIGAVTSSPLCPVGFGDILAIPLAVVVCSALGPFFIMALTCYLFRVRGGSPLAILLLLLSIPLYVALAQLVRIWLVAKSKRVKWGVGLVLMAYSALSVIALSYVAPRM